MMTNQPTSADQVYYATHEHQQLYGDAAQKLGLSTQQYAEFRQDLLTGKVSYVQIPSHIDAMAGQHHGQAYVLHNVQVVQHSMGWSVALRDGTKIYVPQICGNLSMVKAPLVAHKPVHRVVAQRKQPHVVAATHVQPVTPVTFTPPAPAPEVAPVAAPQTAFVPAIVPVVAAAGHGLFLLPAPLLGFFFDHGGNNNTNPPPCSAGSNIMGVCQTGQ